MDQHALSEADRFLLDAVRRGDAEGWSQLVARYQGRLLAFARSRGHGGASGGDAEDIVQETFVSFLQGLRKFRGDASLETYLFTILRRRIVDSRRGAKLASCSLRYGDSNLPHAMAATDQTASWYVRRDETFDERRQALCRMLSELIEEVRDAVDLQTLSMLDALFYAQMRNRDAAAALGVDENLIAVTKHRWLKRIRERLLAEMSRKDEASASLPEEDEGAHSLLTEAWEELRLTCLKRSTIGRHLLGTLEEPWARYVAFHLDVLGCRFCTANRDDLRRESQVETPPQHQRLFQSTVGFLSRLRDGG